MVAAGVVGTVGDLIYGYYQACSKEVEEYVHDWSQKKYCNEMINQSFVIIIPSIMILGIHPHVVFKRKQISINEENRNADNLYYFIGIQQHRTMH